MNPPEKNPPEMRTRSSLIRSAALTSTALLACACGGSGGGSGGTNFFTPLNTAHAVAANSAIVVSERWLVYLADEATSGSGAGSSTDLNGDGDAIDAVAVVIDMASREENILGVAVDPATTDALLWIDDRLYFVVDESRDGVDWNMDLDTTDVVLLSWRRTSGAGFAGVSFVDELEPTAARKMVVVDGALFYASGSVAAAGMESNLRGLEPGSPLTPVPVPTTDAVNPLAVQILGAQEGLLFLLLSEVDSMVDLNADTDQSDLVLALLDGTLVAGVGQIQSTGLAVDQTTPVRARSKTVGDWLVGFLVDESDQDAGSLNDPADFAGSWLPLNCPVMHEDDDTNDEVLHFLHFAPWFADPVGDPPRNTGIAGEDRIVATSGFIGTIASEDRDGEDSLAGACDLNVDGDTLDDVVRWVNAPSNPVDPITLPAGANDEMRALEDVPGGTCGLLELGDRWIIVVDEMDDNNDIDGDGDMDHELVGWMEPGPGSSWTFAHTGGSFAGTTWVGEQLEDGLVFVAVSEDVNGVSLNAPGGDFDDDDSVMTFLNFGAGPTLQFLFPNLVGFAVDEDNGGALLKKGVLMYRVDEAADNRDWNEDGDTADFVLLRTSLSSGFTNIVSVLNGLDRCAVETDRVGEPLGGAIISVESDQGVVGVDFNADGDMGDLVVRYFRF